MIKNDNMRPVGFVNAAFTGCDARGIYVEVEQMNAVSYKLALYDGKQHWIELNTNGCIAYEDIVSGMQSDKDYTICILQEVNEQVEAAYLRNTCLEVQDINLEKMYDKRSLFGNPIHLDENRIVLPFYKSNQVLALTKLRDERHIYNEQIKNEILVIEQDDENNELLHVYTKCKRVEGNYIGIVHKKDIEAANLLESMIPYVNSETSGDHVYLDFELSLKEKSELKNYCTAWICRGQVYYAPLEIRDITKFILISDIQYIKGKGIDFTIVVDELEFGTYQYTECVQIAEEWESANNFKLKEVINACEHGKRLISLTLNTQKKLNTIGKWCLYVHTKKDGESYMIPVTMDEMLYSKELYDCKDSKYKLSFLYEDNLFVIHRVFGHNALFKNNIQSVTAKSIAEFLNGEDFYLKGSMYAEYIQSNEVLKIKLYQVIENVLEAKLVMYNNQNLGVLSCQDIEVVNGTFDEIVVETPDIDWDGKFKKPVSSVWFRLGLAIRTNVGVYFTALNHYDLKTKTERDGVLFDGRSMHLKPIGRKNVCNIEMEALPYYTDKQVLSMKFVRPDQLYRSQFTNELLDVKIKNDIMTIKMRCRDCGFPYKGVLMEYRKVKEDDAESYLIPYTSLKKHKGWYIMTTHIDMKKYYMRMLYWDIRCAFEVDGKIYSVSCHSNNEVFLRKYKGIFVDRTYPNDNSILFPYATGNASVALMHRETCPQDHWPFRLKEKVAQIIYKMFKKYWDSQNVYLVFEKYCTMAQDNGYFFFKYCMEANVEATFDGRIFYVIEKNASDWEKVVPYKDHVLPYLSLRHMIYLQACKLLISTDTKGHAYVWRSMGSDIKALSYEKKLVFLQHGVTAFKRGHFERGTNVGCEYFITTSQFEHDIIHNYLEYPEDEIPITGFARWDVLHDKSEGHREILMMPTWRTWLDDAENDIFAESDYCKNYMALLNDPRLDEILNRYDVTLNFYIHPKFRKFISEFSVVSERIRLIPFGEEPLNELMMQCNLLITDFSSVAWDVYYMNKPVLFYHFDIEVEAKTLGFYMDMEKDIFGERAMEPEELMQLIIEYIENGFVMKEKYSKDREKYFAYVDDNNSERIWAAIQEREW